MRKYTLFIMICLWAVSFSYAQFNLVGTAREDTAPDCFILTPNLYDVSGAVWYTQFVDVSKGFDVYARVYLGNDDYGADGIAFVLQQVSANVGSVGGGIGYEGLVPSIALELDTYKNPWDPEYDHIALTTDGYTTHQGNFSLVAPRPIKNGLFGEALDVEDGQYHDLHISWNALTQEFRAFIDCDLRLTYHGDIVNEIFNGNPFVYWGFTGATGGLRNEHKVCLDYVSFTQELRDTTICQGQNVQLNAATGHATSFRWFPATGLNNPNIANPIATPNVTTVYAVEVTDDCGNIRMDSITITVRPPIQANPQNDIVICATESVQLNASGGAFYQWTPATGLSNPNIANPVATPSVSTTYTVTATDLCGNSQIDSVNISILSSVTTVNAGNDVTICPSESTQLAVTADNGSRFSWAPTTGLSNPNIANPIAFPSTTTTYTVTATDACGNTQTDDVVVNVLPSLLGVNAGNDTLICTNTSLQLNGTAENATSFSWAPTTGMSNPDIANPIASPDSTTIYVLSVTDQCGNTRRDAVTIEVKPTLTIDAGINQTICANESVQLLANTENAVSFSWTPAEGLSDPTIANPVASPNTTTTYVVTATDDCGNSQTDEVTVQVRPSIGAVSVNNDQTICANETVQLNAIAENAENFSWAPTTGLSNPNIANPLATIETTTTYTVTVSDICGNIQTDEVILTTRPNVSSLNVGNDVIICQTASVQLTANAENGSTFLWIPAIGLSDSNIANPIANPDVTTTYSVEVSDVCGNSLTDSMTVALKPSVIVNAGNDGIICEDESIQLNAILENGTNFQWTPSVGLNDPNIANPMASPDVSTTYVVSVTDDCGNIQTDSILISVRPSVTLNASNDETICQSESVQLNAATENGRDFRWTPSVGLSDPDIANPMASPDETTTYVVTVNDGCGNPITDSVVVSVRPSVSVDVGNDRMICANESVQLSTIFENAQDFQWTPTVGLSDPSIANPIATPSSTTAYILTSSDGSICVAQDTIIVQVNELPNVDAGEDESICVGESLELQANGGQDYEWMPMPEISNQHTANPSVTPSKTTTYVVEGTDINGCKNKDSLTVFVNPLPEISTGGDQSICAGEETMLFGEGGVTYDWFPIEGLSDATSANSLANPTKSTSYTLTGTDANGCENTATVLINVKPRPQAEGLDEYEICEGDMAVLSVSGGESYHWSTGEKGSSISVNPTENTSFWVIPKTNGCEGDTLFTQVTVVKLPELEVEISEIKGFSPLEVTFMNLSQYATSYSWEFGDGTTSMEENPTHTYKMPGTYSPRLTGENRLGCTVSLELGEIEILEPPFAFPNAFTPNGDGINDEFDTRVGEVSRYEIMIFNRWGNLIFQTNDPQDHWQGTYKGASVPEGVYVFKLKAARPFSTRQIEVNGTVTLFR